MVTVLASALKNIAEDIINQEWSLSGVSIPRRFVKLDFIEADPGHSLTLEDLELWLK